MKISAVGGLGLANLDSSLEEGFVYPPQEVTYTSPAVNPSITINFEVLHLLVNLLVAGNVCLEFVTLESPFVLEGMELIFQLSDAMLGETWTKKCKFELPVCGAKVAGLAELINAHLGWGPLTVILSLA